MGVDRELHLLLQISTSCLLYSITRLFLRGYWVILDSTLGDGIVMEGKRHDVQWQRRDLVEINVIAAASLSLERSSRDMHPRSEGRAANGACSSSLHPRMLDGVLHRGTSRADRHGGGWQTKMRYGNRFNCNTGASREPRAKLDRNRLATSTRLLRGGHGRDIMTLPDLPSR